MVNDSHLRKSMAYLGMLGASALALMLPTTGSAQQAPPPIGTAPGRPEGPSRSTTTGTPDISASRHPLDPLEPAEIELAVATIRKERRPGDSVRFVSVSLKEPPKEAVGRSRSQNGGECPREAFVILLDKATGRGYEADVNLRAGAIRRYEALPEGVQPPIMLEEFAECEEAVRKSPAFREAMKKRGIEDLSLVRIDAWSAGHYGNEPAEDRGKRLVRGALLAQLRAPRQLLRPADREHRRGRRLEPQGAAPGRGLRRGALAAASGQLGARVHQGDPPRGQTAGNRAARGAELRRAGPRGELAEVVVPGRVQPARGPDPARGRLRRPARAVSRLDRRDDGALRRSQGVVVSQERLRPGRVRHRHDGQLAGDRLRLPGHDPLLRRPPGRQPRPARHDQERDLPARGGFRHALEAHRLAQRPVGGAPIAASRGLYGRHGGQLRLWLLLVFLSGRHDPGGGEAHGDREHDRAGAGEPARHGTEVAPGSSPPITSTTSTPGSTSRSTARTTRSKRSTR